MQEKGNISIHTENIFPIIKKFLYADHEVFLRELVSNAVDACQKMKRLSSLGQYKGELGDLGVEVSFDEKKKTITVSDNGIGMTAEEIKKYINQIAFSGATEFMEKFKEAKDAKEIIGRFGLGFYSAFMVAEKVEIQSLSFQEAASPAQWTCKGSTEFEIAKGKRTKPGTDVILYINNDSEEFLDKRRLQDILDKYCKFLPIPIKFGTTTKEEPDGEDAEGKLKFKSIEIDNIINNTNPIWIKAPSELQEKDYIDFYKELYPFAEEPLFWIHLNVDYPFNLTGVLYFPKLKNEFEPPKHKIKLFSRQVFITDEVKDIVPEFMMLLHGVIDSPDIPLNVSRSFLQADSNVKKINNYITKKVADKLEELFKADRKAYEEKWKDIGLFVKYGMISEEKFHEKAKEYVLLQNVKKEYYTLSEYQAKVKPTQTDKEEMVVYLYTSHVGKQDHFIQAATQKGYDVLVMDSLVDTHFISHLEHKLEKVSLKRVDADVIDKLIQKGDTPPTVLTAEQSKQIKELFEQSIDKPHMKVEVESLSPEEFPVTITRDEFVRRMKDMAKSSSGMGFYEAMPENYKVAVNGNHPLIGKLLKLENAEEQAKLAKQAFDLALLSQGMLQGTELTEFINRTIGLI